MDDEATQPSTQNQLDPRRLGRNNSGLSDSDISDVICILHPSSVAAIRIVNHTAKANAQHVLQNNGLILFASDDEFRSTSELETIIAPSIDEEQAKDLALRFSSNVFDPAVGFCFGRNVMKCDINLDAENKQKRVSNTHFRIFINPSGVLMLEDLSTNGTVVDSHLLGGKKRSGNTNQTIKKGPTTRMLAQGSIIEILSDTPDDKIKFVLRVPSREGFENQYREKFQAYMNHKKVADERALAAQQGPPMPDSAARGILAAPLTGPPNPRSIPALQPPNLNQDYGMHWSGGDRFKCTGVLGKGAFATVYQLATRRDGELFAGKELDKKRFMKHGVLDQRLDNEMQIMKELRHPSIVQYIDYVETEQYLYIIMEYVSCGDLQGYMQAHGTLPENLAKVMTVQILHALAYLHEKNITHRDIKPDNILICSEEPFTVKLTDFGLSKVVKNNETFLKTFCGTLLYCAPEVFPHYDTYAAGKRPKRRRHGDLQQPDRRSYSQQVDIWSYAAVLWFVLCGKPPFEAVQEGTGKGMFNKIMESPLDTSPLEEQGISKECIDLLMKMLNTDPATRPDEAACLRHPWLNEGAVLPGGEPGRNLESIPEGVEDLDASNLSINDGHGLGELVAHNGVESQASDDSSESRSPKRLKGESFFVPREQEVMPSGSEISLQSLPLINDVHDHQMQHPPPLRQDKLFGEISQRALQSSGLLGAEADFREEEGEDMEQSDRSSAQPNGVGHDQPPQQSQPHVDPASTTLASSANGASNASWRESMVRELNMASPEAGNSAIHATNEPVSPHTPSNTRERVALPDDVQKQQQLAAAEETPKAKQSSFNRQINIPVSASFFYDPHDPTTHNPEYASRISGINFLDEASASNIALNSLPETVVASFHSTTGVGLSSQNKENEQRDPALLSAPALLSTTPVATPTDNDGAFVKPAPVLGKLTSTAASFTNLTLNLTSRITTWGRTPTNTLVYRDSHDTRIPKVGLELWFHAKGIEEAEKTGQDWTQMDGLHVIVGTQSNHGITVNNVSLPREDESGRKCFGRLYSGDEVCVSSFGDGKGLRFTCEFFVGRSARKRKDGEKRFVVEVPGES